VSVLVHGGDGDEGWWQPMLPHLPGVHAIPARVSSSLGADEVQVPAGAGLGDRRRVINAHLHVRQLRASRLSVHGVALARSERAVLLLGGHGAGKSLVGLALVERGWDVVAGDVALVEVGEQGGPCPVVLGGTRAYLVCAGALRRYFPSATHASAAGKVDLSGRLPWAPAPDGGLPIAAVALIDVDADPIEPCITHVLDPHTATKVWYRASGHLLDRVLVEGGPLRVLETPALAEKRLDLVRRVGTAMPVRAMRGTPESIALAIENLPGPAPISRETAGNRTVQHGEAKGVGAVIHQVRCVAFDFGGTLASSGPEPGGDLIAEVLSTVTGRQVPPELVAAFDVAYLEVTQADRETASHSPFVHTLAMAARRAGFALTPGEAADAAEAVFVTLPDATPDTDACRAVQVVQEAGLRCVLACDTQRSEPVRRATLAAAGIEDRFSALVLSGALGVRKPHPRFYEAVLRAADCEPGQVLFVGDTYRKDVAGPIHAGMRAVLVARSGRRLPIRTDPGASAFAVVGHVRELPALLGVEQP
jgi:putative hydrolase of the HAD superfamily